ncbi:TPA: hypothetical protein N0F65_005525, partial [Lagenidium giganteum]
SNTTLATVSAVLFGTGIATTNFVTYSASTTTYRFPVAVTGSGPAMSSAHRSPQSPTRMGRSGGTVSLGRALRLPQSRQLRHQSRTV